MYNQALRFSDVYLIARLVWQPVLLHVVLRCPCFLSRGHSEGSQAKAMSATVVPSPQRCRALAA